MENEKMSIKEAWDYNRRGWKLYAKYDPALLISILCDGFLEAAMPYAGIWLSARFVDALAAGAEGTVLLKLAAAIVIVEFVLALLKSGVAQWMGIHGNCLFWTDNQPYMEKFLELDYPNMNDQHTHDLHSQIWQNRNLDNHGTIKTIDILQKLVGAAFQIAGGIGLTVSLFTLKVPRESGFVFLNSPLCAAVLLAVMFGVTALSNRCGIKKNGIMLNCFERLKRSNQIALYFGLEMPFERERAEDMRIYRQQERLGSYFINEAPQSMGAFSEMGRWAKGPMGLWAALSGGLSMVLTRVIYLFVCVKAWAGAFGVGAVTQYVGAITKLFSGIYTLMGSIAQMQANGVFLKTTFELLDMENRMYQGSLTTEKRSDRQYEVEFRDVSFQYPGSSDWALRHVNLKFRVGERLAVVGENGSGKTTFIKLLCRLYDPQEGEILLNGINIRKYRYDDYMALFSVVFQDFWLPAQPLGETVAGSASYDRERVTECLKQAGFEERLKKLPEGLNTYLYKTLSPDGIEFSGGEEQKIAIARALYRNAPFIVLDEPTAALDPVAEAEIYSKFNEIAGDKTAVYISHRLSSCKFCDEIAVFDKGQVVQKGSHEELLKDEEGKYHALWNAQAQYYVEKEA